MSIKFIGMKGKNRLRLKPKTPESQMIVDSLAHTATASGTPIEIFDGSFGICLGQSEISCDGAYGTIGIQGNLDYSVGWTIYLNGQDYGRATSEQPLDYRSDWEFDFKIRLYGDEGNTLWITNSSGSDLRLQLKPDTPLANMSMTFIDSDMVYSQRPSENVLVFEDGSINVCLRNSGPSGPILGPSDPILT